MSPLARGSQNLFGGQSLFRVRSPQFPGQECVEYRRMGLLRTSHFLLSIENQIKSNEILRRGRYGVEERWLELEIGLEVAHFSLHATIQSNCIYSNLILGRDIGQHSSKIRANLTQHEGVFCYKKVSTAGLYYYL